MCVPFIILFLSTLKQEKLTKAVLHNVTMLEIEELQHANEDRNTDSRWNLKFKDPVLWTSGQPRGSGSEKFSLLSVVSEMWLFSSDLLHPLSTQLVPHSWDQDQLNSWWWFFNLAEVNRWRLVSAESQETKTVATEGEQGKTLQASDTTKAGSLAYMWNKFC